MDRVVVQANSRLICGRAGQMTPSDTLIPSKDLYSVEHLFPVRSFQSKKIPHAFASCFATGQQSGLVIDVSLETTVVGVYDNRVMYTYFKSGRGLQSIEPDYILGYCDLLHPNNRTCFNQLFEGLDNILDTALDCIRDCPIDTRRALLENIIVTTDVQHIPGLGEEIVRMLTERYPFAKLTRSPFQMHEIAWIGASLFAHLDLDTPEGDWLDWYKSEP